MEMNILKIDLDIYFQHKAKAHLKERLSYINDLKLLKVCQIEKIELIYKTTYGCKIYLKDNFKNVTTLVMTQLLLGSDYMKETNTLYNHFNLKMEYSNRLFDCKKYKIKSNSFERLILNKPKYKHFIKIAKIYDITKEIKEYILDENRQQART